MSEGSFTALATSTLDKYVESNWVDQIFRADPLYKRLKEKGNMTVDGGEVLLVPVMYGESTSGGSYYGYDALDLTPQEGMGNAQFPWKQYDISVVISGREQRINSGKSAVLKLLDGKITQATKTARDDFTDMLYGDGTGNNSKDLDGLGAAVLATGTYAGISRTAYTWWAASVDATAHDISADGLGWMGTKINTIRGSSASSDPQEEGVVDMILTTQTLYEAIEAQLDTKVRYTMDNLNKANVGFGGIVYKGAVIDWSSKMTAASVYYLSTEYLKLVSHSDCNFITTPFQNPVGQDASVAHIRWMGNLVANSCRHLGKDTNVTA